MPWPTTISSPRPRAYNNVIVAYRNGAPLRIRDIGQAVRGPQNRELAAWQNGKPGVLLLIFKQPNANVIGTEQRIQAALPPLEASIPPAIHVGTVMNRTLTISASVSDIEFTLLLSLALVVMVIFLFLRNVWATIIPSVTVPLALVGTLAAMYVLGFSLDNLSLMALTISIGFVIDDAIVMLENIYRHIEDGEPPMDAAIKGSSEIGFTIVSISCSLIAVFIPLLLMGGIVGRLFREFAITTSATVVVSAFVSLTLTPMLCSRFLGRAPKTHGRLYRIVEAGFDAMNEFYRRTLEIALRFRFITLMVFFITMAISAALFVFIPKGFFPVEDTGIIIGTSEGAQDASFFQMVGLQRKLNEIIGKDPAVAAYGSQVGAGTAGQQGNDGRFYISLKPWNQRPGDDVMKVIARLGQKARAVSGISLYMQPAQDINVGGRLSRTMYQYTLEDAGCGGTQQLGAEDAGQDQGAADAARRRHRPADRRYHGDADHRPRRGAAPRHSAGADRHNSLRRLRPARSRAIFHPAQFLFRHSGSPAAAGGRSQYAQ